MFSMDIRVCCLLLAAFVTNMPVLRLNTRVKKICSVSQLSLFLLNWSATTAVAAAAVAATTPTTAINHQKSTNGGRNERANEQAMNDRCYSTVA